MTEHQNTEVKAVLQSMKADPPDEDGFRDALRARLRAESSLDTPDPLPWYKRHPIFVGMLSGALTAAMILIVAPNFVRPPTGGSPSAAPVAQSPVSTQNSPERVAKNEPKAMPAEVVQPTHRVPSKRVALIKFHFSSEVAVTDVDMKIELPQGLKFWSQGKELVQNQVAWMSNLKQGVNTIPVAVFAASPGRYDVIATAMVDGKPVRHTVVLEVSDEA
ncbi:MAG: hypothetical protein VX589_11840 [Myxococcota bacterium]|nr:hypothetical protein [Myxococcota bacterium]